MSSICWCQVCTGVRYVLVSDMCHYCTTLIFCNSLCTKLHCTAHFLTVLQFQCELCTDCNCIRPQWRMMVNWAKILMSCQIEILPGFCRQIRLCTLHTALREKNFTHCTPNTNIDHSKHLHCFFQTPTLFFRNTNIVYIKPQNCPLKTATLFIPNTDNVHSKYQYCLLKTTTFFIPGKIFYT